VQHIRFGLQTLSERNAHHEFEELCFGLARRRVAANLIPATGPVSAGGDQGRDAESHWTNIPNDLPGSSPFAKGATNDGLALACTTQSSGVPSKIRSDVAAICAQGTPVERVIFFATVGISVATRHQLQAEARDLHDVALEVWDGPAIAEHLADPDLFFLAVDHLRLSSDLAPEVPTAEPDLPEWYVDDRNRWRAKERIGSTLGDLVDLRRPLRYATFHSEARSDLPDWLTWARVVLADARAPEVKARARYEIAVATLRGNDTLRPADDLVRAFFDDLVEFDDVGLLTDAQYLVGYGVGALVRGVTGIEPATWRAWFDLLGQRVDTLLAAGPHPNARANLLALRARHSLHPFPPTRATLAADTELLPVSHVVGSVLDAIDAGDPFSPDLEDLEPSDMSGAMNALIELIAALPQAPLFPIENTADTFDLLAPLLVEHPDYERVRSGLDDAVARSQGDSARADRAYGRAVRFLELGNLLRALNEVHEAKVNWWQGDTMGAGLEMMLLASGIYRELGLPIAAKQHALAAAVASNSSPDPDHRAFAARGLITAAVCDHLAGHWLTATEAFRVGILAQGALVEDPWDIDRHPYFYGMAMNQSLILRAVRTTASAYAGPVEAAVAATGLIDLIGPWVDHVATVEPMTWGQYAAAADEAGSGRPFSDVGPTRVYSWTGLGLTFEVFTENSRLAVLATEGFVAALQVVLAELASEDALLLRSRVIIEVRPDRSTLSSSHDYVEEVPDNHASRWIVHLRSAGEGTLQDSAQELASAVVSVLMASSVMPGADFLALVRAAFERGLWHKLSSARPYDELADFLEDDVYAELRSLTPPPIDAAGEPVPAHGAMKWQDGPAPGYDRDESLQAVEARYRNLLPIVQFTVRRLSDDEAFMKTVRLLRQEGWLDWHLLTAIANYVANHRLRWNGLQPTASSSAQERERMNSLMKAAEQADDPQLPVSDFHEAMLRQSLSGAVLSTLGNLGLTTHGRTPDFPAIFDFLGSRHAYWTDDVPHEPVFPES
jgi:hypothetical protein